MRRLLALFPLGLMALCLSLHAQTYTPDLLYTFCSAGGSNCPNGAEPEGNFIQAFDGNFYSTTFAGGTASAGTVFKLFPPSTVTSLYSFLCEDAASCPQGGFPTSGLIQGPDGALYGTTGNSAFGYFGTIFKISTSGTFATLYTFCPGDAGDSNCAAGSG